VRANQSTNVDKQENRVCIILALVYTYDVSIRVDCGRFQTRQIVRWMWNQQQDHHTVDKTL